MSLTFTNIENDMEWDMHVLSMPKYSFLNSSARFRYNKDVGTAFRYLISDGNSPLGIISISIGFSKIFGKFLECKHSPMLLKDTMDYWNEVKDFCMDIAKENNCFMFRFSPLYSENNVLESFYSNSGFVKAPIHNVDALISQQIDLRKDMEVLKMEMNKTKRNLLNRLLSDEKVSVQIFSDDSQFELFKDFHEQTVNLKGYTDKPTDLLLRELREQVKDQMCHMLVGYYDGKPIGIWQCTVYGSNMHLYQACMDTSFRDKNINITYFLFWEALKLGKEKGCSTFDLFGGVVPKDYEERDHPWRGINDFKQSLGGEKVTYMHSMDYVISKWKYPIYYIYSEIRTRLKGHTTKW